MLRVFARNGHNTHTHTDKDTDIHNGCGCGSIADALPPNGAADTKANVEW